ncbi:efflux RND transporter periplasmic adaptor subunit [Novipirellula artificiosorum]|nr:HlyD family efflux transporter periplasmic adaptor subunit [Novipirellula artificiosorum]
MKSFALSTLAMVVMTSLAMAQQIQPSPGLSSVPSADLSAEPIKPGEIRAENCIVIVINTVNVPAEVDGKLMELKFKEGATVAAGDLMAVIDDSQARLAVELKKAEEKEAEIKALNDVQMRDARNSEKLASAELKAFENLRAEGAIPYWELEKKRLEANRGKLKIELSQQDMDIAKVQYLVKKTEREMAEAELKKRQITAPFGGFIETRIAQLGSWVQAGTPIATLVQLDKLRVQGVINGLRYPEVRRGMPVEVFVSAETDTKKALSFQGTIDFVSSEMDLRHQYRVWVEIENQQQGEDWIVKPGMRAEIIVKPNR